MGTLLTYPERPTQLCSLSGRGYNASQGPFYYNGKLFWCGVTHIPAVNDATAHAGNGVSHPGSFLICEYDLITRTFDSHEILRLDNVWPDDHNSGAILLTDDGHILYSVKGHGGSAPQYLQYGRSVSSGTVAGGFIERSIEITGTGGMTSSEYNAMARLSKTGRTYIFGRRYMPSARAPGYPGGHNSCAWVCYGWSDDDFQTELVYKGNTHLLTYGTVSASGTANPQSFGVILGSNHYDRIYFSPFHYWNTAFDFPPPYGNSARMPNTDTCSIFYMEMDENGVLYTANQQPNGYNLHTIDASGPVPQSAMSQAQAQLEGFHGAAVQVFKDDTGAPVIVWQKSTVPMTTADMYVNRWNGSSWDSVLFGNTGNTINSDGSANGALGILDEANPKTGYIAIENPAGTWRIYRKTTTNWASWALGENLLAEYTASLANKCVRPAVVSFTPGAPILMFTEFVSRTKFWTWEGYNKILVDDQVFVRAAPDSIEVAPFLSSPVDEAICDTDLVGYDPIFTIEREEVV